MVDYTGTRSDSRLRRRGLSLVPLKFDRNAKSHVNRPSGSWSGPQVATRDLVIDSEWIVGKLDTVAGPISSGVQCRCGRSRHLESVACSRGSARSFGLKRAQAETESVQVRHPQHDRAARMSSEGREVRASQCPLYGYFQVQGLSETCILRSPYSPSTLTPPSFLARAPRSQWDHHRRRTPQSAGTRAAP